MPTTRTRSYFYAKASLVEADFDDLVYSALMYEDSSAIGRSILGAADAAAVRALISASDAVPTGTVIQWAGVAAGIPSGYILCNGASLLRASYAALFGVIGTSFGAADGTHFNVPDLSASFVKGASADGDVGDVGGSATHGHSDTTGSANTLISVSVPGATAMAGGAAVGASGAATVTDPGHSHPIALSAVNNEPPYARMYFLIKT